MGGEGGGKVAEVRFQTSELFAANSPKRKGVVLDVDVWLFKVRLVKYTREILISLLMINMLHTD